jgi:peroxiredoxin Q/BCP
MAELKVGQKAPAFNLAATGGKKVALKDFAGKPMVLFFYPKDNTSG